MEKAVRKHAKTDLDGCTAIEEEYMGEYQMWLLNHAELCTNDKGSIKHMGISRRSDVLLSLYTTRDSEPSNSEASNFILLLCTLCSSLAIAKR